MAAWRYEISLLVLKKYFTRSRNIFQHSKRNSVPPRGHVISSLSIYIYFFFPEPSLIAAFYAEEITLAK